MTPPLPSGVLPGGRFETWIPHASGLVVCDVDGTLVGPHHHASDEVVDAVGRLQAGGPRVGVATGRSRDAVGPLVEQLGALGPHVLHNGAEVRADAETIAAWTLDEPAVDAILALANAREDCYVEIYPESGFLASSWDERARVHWEMLHAEPTTTIRSAAQLEGAAVMKATFVAFDPATADDLTVAIRELGLGVGVAGSPRAPTMSFINVMHPDTDKGRALVNAADFLDLDLQQVTAIGDAENDLAMFEVAGTAVAMGQASAAVRGAAHLVVPAVDDHGVAVALDAVATWSSAA